MQFISEKNQKNVKKCTYFLKENRSSSSKSGTQIPRRKPLQYFWYSKKCILQKLQWYHVVPATPSAQMKPQKNAMYAKHDIIICFEERNKRESSSPGILEMQCIIGRNLFTIPLFENCTRLRRKRQQEVETRKPDVIINIPYV